MDRNKGKEPAGKRFSSLAKCASRGVGVLVAILLVFPSLASADLIQFNGPGGLSGTADFTFSGNTLRVLLTNTSTSVPSGFKNSDQLLTSIAFNLPGSMAITGGSVQVGSSSNAYFQIPPAPSTTYPGGTDISGEWGYGNSGTTGFGTLVNFVSAMEAGTTAFGGMNLGAGSELDGPQGGLTNGIVDLGGLGAVRNSVYIALNLSAPLAGLDFLRDGAVIEFGSDAAFARVPEPGLLLLLGSGFLGLALAARRRRS